MSLVKQVAHSTHPVIASLDHPLYFVKRVLIFLPSLPLAAERAEQRSAFG
jgi:hypothetical protein